MTDTTKTDAEQTTEPLTPNYPALELAMARLLKSGYGYSVDLIRGTIDAMAQARTEQAARIAELERERDEARKALSEGRWEAEAFDQEQREFHSDDEKLAWFRRYRGRSVGHYAHGVVRVGLLVDLSDEATAKLEAAQREAAELGAVLTAAKADIVRVREYVVAMGPYCDDHDEGDATCSKCCVVAAVERVCRLPDYVDATAALDALLAAERSKREEVEGLVRAVQETVRDAVEHLDLAPEACADTWVSSRITTAREALEEVLALLSVRLSDEGGS